MSSFLLGLIYNILYPLFLLIALPGYLVKMYRRGGYGTGMLERFGIYKRPLAEEPQGGVYVHAVSVGEVLIALKWIRVWLREQDSEHNGKSHKGLNNAVVLAVTTPTGHAVARAQAPQGVRVVYSPLDVPGLPGRCLDRFAPRAVVLIEAELWLNMAKAARKRGIAHVMLNARVSPRSESRYRRAGALSRWYFSFLDTMGVQDEDDARRFREIGVPADKIVVTGSIKFDPADALIPAQRSEFSAILDALTRPLDSPRPPDSSTLLESPTPPADSASTITPPVVLVASSHAGEEALLAPLILQAGAFPLIVPRHAERRAEITRALRDLGIVPLLRTELSSPASKDPTAQETTAPQEATESSSSYNLEPLIRARRKAGDKPVAYIADTTGELRDWTAHADLVIIGKSFLSEGGQTPVEAILADKPVLAGEHMENFQALVDLLIAEGGITQASITELPSALDKLLRDDALRQAQIQGARRALAPHEGAVRRSVRLVEDCLH